MQRCSWCTKDPLYIKYHDLEWGVPVSNDRKLFEFITLEGAQAGLNWFTILKKRKNYQKAFDNYNVKKIANYNTKKVDELLSNSGIIRNRLKILSTITNAQSFLAIQREFGSFYKYQCLFIENKSITNRWSKINQIPTSTKISDAFSKDLKARGFKFVGTTIVYAYMQAIGMVNDHVTNCFRYSEINN